MKNILIIGGSYFAGRIFVEELVKDTGNSIYVFNRGNRPLKMKGVTELIGDRNDEEKIKEVIPELKWDVLIDFCAYAPEHIEKMVRTLPGELKQYIFISTTSTYQDTTELPTKEDALQLTASQPELGPYADYGYHKCLAEQRLHSECEKRGIAWTTIRPAIIYGEYNYAPRETYFFDLIRDGKTIILPENELALFSFVWVVDMANIIKKCLLNEKVFNQAFNIAGEDLVSYKRMVEVFSEISGKETHTEKKSTEEIDRERIPLPFPLESHLVYSGTKVKEVLDFEYTPFKKGMKYAYEYYKLVQKHKG